MAEVVLVSSSNGCGGGGGEKKAEQQQQQQQQGQVLELLLSALRKSVVLPCQMADADDPSVAWGMDIGWPTDVRHVAHVTFDRLQGFLGLPVEFELEIPCQVPSARSVIPASQPAECAARFSVTDSRFSSSPVLFFKM
jgi:hypothetical protein